MTTILVIIALVLLLIGLILWLPIVLKIDTETGEYFIRYKGLARMNLEGDPTEIIRLKLKVFFMNFTFYPLREKKVSDKKKGVSRKPKIIGKHLKMKKIFKLMRTFKIKRAVLDLDTGDFAFNAKLIPAFMLLKMTGGDFSINFVNRNRLALVIYNRPIYILKSIINF